jgi:hypothetical protein
LFSIPVNPVRCGLSPSLVWCLLLSSFPSFNSCRLLWRVDQRKVNLVSPFVFRLFCARVLVCLYPL